MFGRTGLGVLLMGRGEVFGLFFFLKTSVFIVRGRREANLVCVHASLHNAADASSTHFTQPARVGQPYSLARFHPNNRNHIRSICFPHLPLVKLIQAMRSAS